MRKGKLYLAVSALIYGILPVFAKWAAVSGCDGVTLVFLRSTLGLPLLLVLIKLKEVNLHLTKKEIKSIVILGACGSAPSMVLLYSAYTISSVGVASMLHFVYPFVTVIACVVIFKEKMSLRKVLGAAAAAVGVLLSLDMNTNMLGAVLAVLSGVFYAFFTLYMDKSGIDGMNYLKLTFYMSVIMSLTAVIMCIIGNGINLPQGFTGWGASVIASVLTTLFAVPMFQLGVKYEGAADAGIISLAEPVVGVLSGAVFLGEKITTVGIAGCLLITLGVFCIEKPSKSS